MTSCDQRRIFDVHTHAFPDAVAAKALPKLLDEWVWERPTAYFDGTLAGLLSSMDRAGIDRAVMCAVATRPDQVPKITDWCVRVASERIVPFASIHPDWPDPEAEVARVAEAGLRGLKFHPQYMGCAIDDGRALRIARAAEAADLAMLVHSGYDLAYEKDELASPRQVRRLHETCPDLRLVAAHLGGWQRWEEVLEHLAGLPVYLETSYSLGWCPPEVVDRLVAAHPAAYLCFGTDAPWTDQAEEVEKFLALDLPDGVKRRAMWENPMRVIGGKREAGSRK